MYADTFHFGLISQTSSHETKRNTVFSNENNMDDTLHAINDDPDQFWHIFNGLKIELLDVYHTMRYVDIYMKEFEEFEEMKRKRDDGNISVKNTGTIAETFLASSIPFHYKAYNHIHTKEKQYHQRTKIQTAFIGILHQQVHFFLKTEV